MNDLGYLPNSLIFLIVKGVVDTAFCNLLQLGPSFPNDVGILEPKVDLGPNYIEIDLRKVFSEKYNSFMNHISYFWKRKATETLVCEHTYYAPSIYAYACLTHTCTYTGMHAHARVLETMKCNFFSIKDWFWNKFHIFWELFQTPIFRL